MLVATAGHIDHGKTSLIRALTGVETDRLPEERSRGISIDLGFAYWHPEPAITIGFVDVPGHERFIRNMLAGVSGIDLALIVVAADDGVMPQTIEHVQMLDMLGIARGIVAITKADRVGSDRVDQVGAQIGRLLAPTKFAGATMHVVSATTGAGIAALAGALLAASRELRSRLDPDRHFRMSIDRVFTVSGAGTIVTGTILDGTIMIGAHVMLSPAGKEVRVRGIQSAGDKVDEASAGMRCALNLVGLTVDDAHRGDWLVAPEMFEPTSRLEVRLQVLATRDNALSHHAPVRVHLGTADLPARVLIPRQGRIEHGDSRVVTLALEGPTSAVVGDHFVLRDQSGRDLVGGGRIVDPFPHRDRRRVVLRSQISDAMEAGSATASLAALAAIPGHEIETPHFERAFYLKRGAAEAIYRERDIALVGQGGAIAVPAARVTAIEADIIDVLEALHRDHPEIRGFTPRSLRTRLGTPVSAEMLADILRRLAERRLVDLGGSLAKLAGHAAAHPPIQDKLWRDLVAWQDDSESLFFAPDDAYRELHSSDAAVNAVLHRRRVTGDLWRITERHYAMRERMIALVEIAAALARSHDPDGFSAADFRDAAAIGRNMVIRVLEYFDTANITLRRGNLRVMRDGYRRAIGLSDQAAPDAASV